MRNAVLFLVNPVCRLITRPCWFLQHWEEVKQSATHTQPLRGDNRLQTHRQTLRSEGPVKTNHYDTLHSFFYSTAPCHRPSQSLVPRAMLRTEKTNHWAVKPQTSPSLFCQAPHHVSNSLSCISTPLSFSWGEITDLALWLVLITQIMSHDFSYITCTDKCTKINRSGCKRRGRCTYWYTLCANTYTHTVYKRHRGPN